MKPGLLDQVHVLPVTVMPAHVTTSNLPAECLTVRVTVFGIEIGAFLDGEARIALLTPDNADAMAELLVMAGAELRQAGEGAADRAALALARIQHKPGRA